VTKNRPASPIGQLVLRISKKLPRQHAGTYDDVA